PAVTSRVNSRTAFGRILEAIALPGHERADRRLEHNPLPLSELLGAAVGNLHRLLAGDVDDDSGTALSVGFAGGDHSCPDLLHLAWSRDHRHCDDDAGNHDDDDNGAEHFIPERQEAVELAALERLPAEI